MADIYEIIATINQIASQAYDGGCDQEGNPLEIGLNREKGDPILDPRIVDGFKVKFQGRYLILNYSSETTFRDIYKEGNFKNETISKIDDIASFIKKEYRKIKNEILNLKKVGEPDIFCQHISNYRTWVEAQCIYEIGNINAESSIGEAEKKVQDNFEKWLKQQGA